MAHALEPNSTNKQLSRGHMWSCAEQCDFSKGFAVILDCISFGSHSFVKGMTTDLFFG